MRHGRVWAAATTNRQVYHFFRTIRGIEETGKTCRFETGAGGDAIVEWNEKFISQNRSPLNLPTSASGCWVDGASNDPSWKLIPKSGSSGLAQPHIARARGCISLSQYELENRPIIAATASSAQVLDDVGSTTVSSGRVTTPSSSPHTKQVSLSMLGIPGSRTRSGS